MTFYATKKIDAAPMTRAEYNIYRGWDLPANENGDDKGFLVEYANGGESNHPDHRGYISWSPADVFEESYQENGNLSFGHAVHAMKAGKKVCRSGWNGKGMFLFLVPGSTFKVNRAPLLGIYELGSEIKYQPHIDMKTAQDTVVPWLASQSDVLANDWEVLED